MKLRKVFVTGGGGFVGRTLLEELRRLDNLEIVALDRAGSVVPAPGLTIVRGDLLEPHTYRAALAGCDAVLHLAASTGKASAATHMRETAGGTAALVEACREADVSRLLLVSSIAAAFPDKRGYPYAQAKERAEHSVMQSGLRYAIVRPTMILGEGSPILASLSKLALLPVIVVPGRGTVRVQPVARADVVRAIVRILRDDRFDAETFEIGGPETLTMAALLQRIRTSRTGRPGSALRVPLGVLQGPLLLAEKMGLRAVLPATAGQLSSFRHEGVAAPGSLEALLPERESLDTMFAAATGTDREDDLAAIECRVFVRHLVGLTADAAVVQAYQRALVSREELRSDDARERALLAVARRGSMGVRCADAFASLFARSSVLRKRLVVLLAILETRPPFSDRLDAVPDGGRIAVLAGLALRAAWSLVLVVPGALWVLVSRMTASGARTGSR